MTIQEAKQIMDNKAIWELEEIVKALTFVEMFNTDDDNIRLKSARLILKSRKEREERMKTVNFNSEGVNGDYKNIVGYKWSPFEGIDLVVHKSTFSDNYWDVSEPVSGYSLTNIVRSTTMKRTKELAIKFIDKKGVQTTVDVIKRVKRSIKHQF